MRTSSCSLPFLLILFSFYDVYKIGCPIDKVVTRCLVDITLCDVGSDLVDKGIQLIERTSGFAGGYLFISIFSLQ